jgi:hypothetical protein
VTLLKRNPFIVLIIFLLLLSAPLIQASTTSSTELSLVTLPVSSRSATDFKKTLYTAFNQILVRLTGDTSIATLPEVQRIQSQAKQYVQYYRYVSTPTDSHTPSTLQLKIVFDIQGLQTLLQKINVPIWPQSDRPTPLIWLQFKRNDQVELLSSTMENDLTALFRSLSTQYAVPILLPSMDLQDLQLSPKVIDSKHHQIIIDNDTLQSLMQRYLVKTTLIGSLSQSTASKIWNSQWQLSFMHETYQWTLKNTNLDEIIQQTFQNMINVLVNYTQTTEDVNASQEKSVILHIYNVNNLQSYNQILRYIHQLNEVKQSSLQNVSQDTMTFKLTLSNSNVEKLITHLNQNNQLHFIRMQSMAIRLQKSNIQNLIPILYYDYGQTTTAEY